MPLKKKLAARKPHNRFQAKYDKDVKWKGGLGQTNCSLCPKECR